MREISQLALNRSGLDWRHLRLVLTVVIHRLLPLHESFSHACFPSFKSRRCFSLPLLFFFSFYWSFRWYFGLNLERMGPNAHWPSHVSEIYGEQIFFPDALRLKQDHHNPASAVFNQNSSAPPSFCLTTHDSSSIPHDLDSQNQNIPCCILTNHLLKTPPSSSRLVNHSCTGSTTISCTEILSGLNKKKLNNSIASHLPSINQNTPCSILTNPYPNTPSSSSSSLIKQSSNSSTTSGCCSEILNGLNNQHPNSKSTYLPCVNYGSVSAYKIYDSDSNLDEIHMQQSMDLDEKPSLLTKVNLDEHLAPPVLSLPNLMINDDNVMCHSSERLSYGQWFQQSQFEQQQKMVILQPNFQYFGSAISYSDFAENPPIMEMGMCEDSIDTPTQIDLINKLPHQGIVGKSFERKQKRMLKNRESAARSRAKKQAIVNHLENKCWTLKKNNNLLNKEQVFLRSLVAPKVQLRRASSMEGIKSN